MNAVKDETNDYENNRTKERTIRIIKHDIKTKRSRQIVQTNRSDEMNCLDGQKSRAHKSGVFAIRNHG